MAPTTYTGGLSAKKKAELQEIASALDVDDEGTKEELQTNIRRHLELNEASLIDNPMFSGLFGRRKRSVPPPSTRSSVQPEAQSVVQNPTASFIMRKTVLTMDPIHESTPNADMRDVSMMLKRQPVQSPSSDSDNNEESPKSLKRNPTQAQFGTPSSLPGLPPTPSPMRNVFDTSLDETRSVVEKSPRKSLVPAATAVQEQWLHSTTETVDGLREFLSDSLNIWSLTALGELLTVLIISTTWASFQVPLTPEFLHTRFTLFQLPWVLSIPYPALTTFTSAPFWYGLLNWAAPTVLIPAFIASLVSFSETRAVDPLTASIVRLAAQIAYPYHDTPFNGYIPVDQTRIPTYNAGIQSAPAAAWTWGGPDMLGFRIRVLNSSVNLAFAFAEAITKGRSEPTKKMPVDHDR